MYAYIECGILGLASIDLPKTVIYKPRRKVRDWRIVDRNGRNYSYYLELPENIKENAVQMDCFIGKAHNYKCILTMHFSKWKFRLLILLERHTPSCAVGALDFIETVIGYDRFKELFRVIQIDRGI